MWWAGLAVVGLCLLLGCAEKQGGEERKEREVLDWLSAWASQHWGRLVCAGIITQELSRGSYTTDSEGLVELARVYGADSLLRADWTNISGGAICFYLVKMPSAWHAYEVYESIGGGGDETAVRGGPSKRVGQGVMVVKDQWVVWDDGGTEAVTLGEREAVRRALYRSIPGKWQFPRVVRKMMLLEPKPARVHFQPQDALGMGVFDAAMIAQLVSGVRTAELFVCTLEEHELANSVYARLRRWIERNELVGVEVRDGERCEFFVPDTSVEYLYVVCTSNQLYGVRGMESVADARALLSRWDELNEAIEN